MTYQEFLDQLKNVTPEGAWYLDVNGEIRCFDRGLKCPGLVLDIFGKVDFCWDVAAAADNNTKSTRFNTQIRKDLLEACGLAES